ncbi:M23 family metallopeptidase [Belnapia rosea]|uniref:Peptidase family M23 n=1 Tax=Belnapia rosea TaxID=938405 RepID=A0A1G7ETM8_9PROT|nr:M23 family metallopeptidase [Belnapia rosea]SDB62018.1 Peptidase family M23 [Belnapia rosea]SDE66962.1 Peptidase family M23 [Belnapia rosea]
MLHCVARHARWLTFLAVFLASPAAPAQPDPPKASPVTQTEAVRVLVARPGDTLTQLLVGAGVEPAEARPALSALAPIFPPRRLQPGHEVTLRQDPSREDALTALILEPAPGRTVTVMRTPSGWQAVEEESTRHRHLVYAQGEVTGALLHDLERAGLPQALGLDLVRMLGHAVDFQRELQPGDGFTVLFERFRDAEGGLLRDGDVLHAEFRMSTRRLSLWRQETANGPEWFDENGRSLRRNFLRTPLDGARVSSGFGQRRHPVLGFTRMHQGIDFAAPTGTPVLAAAEGVVERIGFAGGYGRLIELRHPDGSMTRYAHLSGFARGMQLGSRVGQGEAIGRVGSSGLATGPHLHYEIVENGRSVDPAIARPAATVQLAGAELEAFQRTRTAILAQIAHLEPMQEVAWAE